MAIIPFDLRDGNSFYFTHPKFDVHGECADFVVAFGRRFEGYLLINNSLFTLGSTLTFEWGSNSVSMNLTSPLYLEDYGTLLSSDPQQFSFSAAANKLLNTDFEFVDFYNDTYITIVLIKARKKGAEYDLQVASSSSATSYLSVINGTDTVLNKNINVLCDVFKLVAGEYKYLASIKSALIFNDLEVDYQFFFDLADFFHRHLFCENIKYYDFSDSGLIIAALDSKGVFKLSLKQSEGWNGSYNTDPYHVLRGGLTKRDYVKWKENYWGNYPDSNIWRLLNYVTNYTNKYFEAAPNQKLYSSFVCFNIETDDYTFLLNITDELNNTGSENIYSESIRKDTKYTLNYSYDDLGIGLIADSLGLGKVKNWSIVAQDSSLNEFLIDFRVLVENDYRENFFVFENSLGGFQTLRTLGAFEFGVEIDKAEFEKSIPVLTLVDENFMVGETYSHTFKGEVFSGWLDLEDIYNFLDFLSSENIWKQDDRHEAMTPIKILKGNWSIFTNSNNGVRQYGFKFQYVEVARNKHVTDLIAY
jgi:hypothetical protein